MMAYKTDRHKLIRLAVLLITVTLTATIGVGCRNNNSFGNRGQDSHVATNTTTDVPKIPNVATNTTSDFPQISKMEILYTSGPENNQRACLCILSLPSNRTEDVLEKANVKNAFGELIGSAVFSPDGNCILFTAMPAKRSVGARPAAEQVGLDEESDLWIFNRRTKSLKRLTFDQQGYSSLKWSPDGRYVSASGFRGWTSPDIPPTLAGVLKTDLYVWEVRTGRRWLLGKNDQQYTWMPNSRAVVFITQDDIGQTTSLYVWQVQLARKRHVAQNIGIALPMPDGKRLLFNKYGTNGLYWTSIAGGPAALFTNATDEMTSPVWSPDGRVLAYLQGTTRPGDVVLKLLAISPKSSRSLLNKAGSFLWAPNGRTIAVAVNEHDLSVAAHETKIVLVDVVSGTTKTVAMLQDDASLLGWAKNGEILFVLNSRYHREQINDQTGLVALPKRVLAISAVTSNISELAQLPDPHITLFDDWRLVGSSHIQR
jgi:dipeptidyl aminopeptidase/acylaminoacyl peptidase